MIVIKNKMASSDEYVEPANNEEVWKHTSKWRAFQLEELNIDIQDGYVVNMQDLNNIPLYIDVERILMPGINISSSIDINTIPDSQLPFFNRLNQLSIFRDEPPVDSIAHDLLTFTGYESRKLHFRPKPNIKMQWKNHNIASEADYGVFTERSRTTANIEYLVIVEDKSISGKTHISAERQLCGEMLVAAMERFQSVSVDQFIYGMIIKGPLIRFYYCTFEENYLSCLDKDRKPIVTAIIHRYPSAKEMALSLNDSDQRKTIIQILSRIRVHLESLI
jgi:hypothetical protein